MLHSLRGRLILLTSIGLLVTGILALIFISQAIEETFFAYISEQENARLERVESLESVLPEMLSAYYRTHPNPSELAKITEDLEWLIPGEFVLTSRGGRQLLPTADIGFCGSPLSVMNQGQAIGQICFESDSRALELVDATPFQASVQSSLITALLIASGLALFLTLVFANRLLKPLDALTRAVHLVDRGQIPPPILSNSVSEIQELTSAFNAMAARLEQAETLRQNMVSDVAHELRTPLTNLAGYLEAADDGVVELTPALIRSLMEEATLLTRLVDDLQDLALAESSQIPMQIEPLQIKSLIAAALQILQLPADKKAIELTIGAHEYLPLVAADETRIHQVLRNLIDNAVAHTPNGGRVTISARTRQREVEVRVNNTGQPINAQHLPFVFERFYRADRSRARATGGYGLGLAIVKQLIEAHGGRVGVESTPTAGTSFFFTLPLAVSS